ncbi:EboA domain-containing protein [Algivirga pacifica]|uniref:Uncharacterized protein n=1 Tax=Algivirga pacifica TaxID=1162670 RepID=A0ABP9DC09_9BACT
MQPLQILPTEGETLQVLGNTLKAHVSPGHWTSFEEKWKVLKSQERDSMFYRIFSTLPKMLENGDEQIAIPTFSWVNNWTLLELARVYFLVRYQAIHTDRSDTIIRMLFDTADEKEFVALYKALPFLPNPSRYVYKAVEGLRTNMTTVFDAVALENPYPVLFFEDHQWNQMILKAIFMERPMYKIYGVDQRHNFTLFEMLRDYVMERWSAARNVTPELWRFTVPYLRKKHLPLLKGLLDKEGFDELAAYIISAQTKVRGLKDLRPKQIRSFQMNWDQLGETYHKAKPKRKGYQQTGSGYTEIDIR